jgi:hypothetical protein
MSEKANRAIIDADIPAEIRALFENRPQQQNANSGRLLPQTNLSFAPTFRRRSSPHVAVTAAADVDDSSSSDEDEQTRHRRRLRVLNMSSSSNDEHSDTEVRESRERVASMLDAREDERAKPSAPVADDVQSMSTDDDHEQSQVEDDKSGDTEDEKATGSGDETAMEEDAAIPAGTSPPTVAQAVDAVLDVKQQQPAVFADAMFSDNSHPYSPTTHCHRYARPASTMPDTCATVAQVFADDYSQFVQPMMPDEPGMQCARNHVFTRCFRTGQTGATICTAYHQSRHDRVAPYARHTSARSRVDALYATNVQCTVYVGRFSARARRRRR